MYATGLELQQDEVFQQGYSVYDALIPSRIWSYPAPDYEREPAEYRMAWWTTDPRVVQVNATGRLMAVGRGQAVVWVQVESARDSAVVRVGPAATENELRFARVAAAQAHTCGLDSHGAAYCWGMDQSGTLGSGAIRWFSRMGVPLPVRGGYRFLLLATRGDHTCGLLASGQARCWGSAWYGALGTGERLPIEAGLDDLGEPVPVAVSGGVSFDTLVATANTTCGLDATGAAYCWGSNAFGQLGIGENDTLTIDARRVAPEPVAGELSFRLLSAGVYHVCGLTGQGSAYCWGMGGDHLGHEVLERCNSIPVCAPRPQPVETDLAFVALAAGLKHTCGLTEDGSVYCWGDNETGALGRNDVSTSVSPLAVQGNYRFEAVAAGSGHTCALTPGGVAYCWGVNSYGQLGGGDTEGAEGSNTPLEVAGGLTFTSLSPAQQHTCGVTVSGAAYCWGWLRSVLGNGSVLPPLYGQDIAVHVPVRVAAPFSE